VNDDLAARRVLLHSYIYIYIYIRIIFLFILLHIKVIHKSPKSTLGGCTWRSLDVDTDSQRVVV